MSCLAISLIAISLFVPPLYAQQTAAQGGLADTKNRLVLIAAPGPSPLSEAFSEAASALEPGLLALVPAKDKKAAEAALSALRSHRNAAEEAERSLLYDWSAWAEALATAGGFESGSTDPLSGYDRAAYEKSASSLRAAEGAALAAAQGMVAKAAVAKGFNASAISLLSAYARRLELPEPLRAGESAIAALKADSLKKMLAACLSARPRLYVEALAAALPRDGYEGSLAAEAFRSAVLAGADSSISSAVTLGAKAGEAARLLGLYYTGADFYGFLSTLLLARPAAERAFLTASGLSPAQAFSAFGSASVYAPWPRVAIDDTSRQRATELYAAWLSAWLRKDGSESALFALFSAAPGHDDVLASLVAAQHRSALEQSFERHWLRAKEALSLDLRADTLLWLRSQGLRLSPDALSLELDLVRWPSLNLRAGIELIAIADGSRYAVPYTAVEGSVRASLGSVFASELPAFVYLENRGGPLERFEGSPEQSALILQALGEDLSARYAPGMAWSLESWMEPYLDDSARIRGLARLYAQSAAAARALSEPWYAAVAGQAPRGGRP